MALFCTDWLNGYNLIEEGHVVWGLMTALLPFLPGAVVGLYLAWYFLKGGIGGIGAGKILALPRLA